MPKPTREIRKRTTAPVGAPAELAEHFCTGGQYWPADQSAGFAAIQPRADDWSPEVANIVRRRVPKRAFEMLEREYGGGPHRPFAWWPREVLAELRRMVGSPNDD